MIASSAGNSTYVVHTWRRVALLILLGIASILTTTDVGAQADAAATAESLPLAQCIQKKWWHSMEEDTDEVVVYRPEGYPFPPARGRIGFEFLAGGYLVYYGIGPADEPTLQHGRWDQPGHTRITIAVDEPGQPVIEETWNVLSCGADLLEVER